MYIIYIYIIYVHRLEVDIHDTLHFNAVSASGSLKPPPPGPVPSTIAMWRRDWNSLGYSISMPRHVHITGVPNTGRLRRAGIVLYNMLRDIVELRTCFDTWIRKKSARPPGPIYLRTWCRIQWESLSNLCLAKNWLHLPIYHTISFLWPILVNAESSSQALLPRTGLYSSHGTFSETNSTLAAFK